jgi:hypothetical protein
LFPFFIEVNEGGQFDFSADFDPYCASEDGRKRNMPVVGFTLKCCIFVEVSDSLASA